MSTKRGRLRRFRRSWLDAWLAGGGGSATFLLWLLAAALALCVCAERPGDCPFL